MDFEPFQSDNEDEEEVSFIAEKKKKESSEKRKKSKSGQLFRSEKKEKTNFSDLHSPVGTKHKHSVHGVIGPADYMYDQNSPGASPTPPAHPSTPLGQPPKPTLTPSQPTQWSQPQFYTPYQVFTGKSTSAFPTNFSAPSSKVERPHSSAAVMAQDQHSHSLPIPFKQSLSTANVQSPQKTTLLSQAMSNQLQTHTTHQRNQSYSRAMSLPIVSKSPNDDPTFSACFESTLEVNTEEETDGAPSPVVSPTGGRPTSAEFWSKSQDIVNTPNQVETDWAKFPVSTSLQDEMDDSVSTSSSVSRRKSQGGESIGESMSSFDSEADEMVWHINEEQRDYYTEQFRNLQPDDEIIKGAQARDFFLKSNLPTETLSKIWHLSDLDKDYALNLAEFCIAMHLVVAVRHGVELPQVLPLSMLAKDEGDPFEADLGSPDVESFSSDKLSDDKWGVSNTLLNGSCENLESVQTLAQPSHISSSNTIEHRSHPISTVDSHQQKPISSSTEALDIVDHSPKQRHNSSPSSQSASSLAIARPRASANKNVNLMDASPWQLLPPPSSRGTIKKCLVLEDKSSVKLTQDHTLVNIEKSVDGVTPLPDYDLDDSFDRLKANVKYHGGLTLKDKSRSIDSLRSDISESSEFQWRRQSIKTDPKRRSLTIDKISYSSETSLHERTKEFELPPVPPPRVKGHVRASSLDLNNLFNSKSPPEIQSIDVDEEDARPKPSKPPRVGKPLVTRLRSSPLLDRSFHRRSCSLDSKFILQSSAKQKQVTELHVDIEAPNNEGPHDVAKPTVRFSEEADDSKSPLEIEMRRNEVQARIVQLQSNNLILHSLNNELNLEWKELCEQRINFDVQLQKIIQRTMES